MAPRSTYRLQLRAGFDFDHVIEVAAYLAELGVSHLYLSPLFSAVPGSEHGYDVVDPRHIDPVLGGEEAYARMTAALREQDLGQVLDIVPNHMATHSDNPWWWDVLRNGASSRYARFFDIDWEGPREASWSKVLAPILEDHYGRVLESGELHIRRAGSALEVGYHEQRLPLSPESAAAVLAGAARRSGNSELSEVAVQLSHLPAHDRDQALRSIDARLRHLLTEPEIAGAVDAEAGSVSADIDRLDTVLQEQNYRLASWRTANEELDYRRFFSIETLVGVRADDPEVLAETHGLVFDLVRDGAVDGIRIDHIDGIRDPHRYLSGVREAVGPVYAVVEKILEDGESLPDSWPVAGTTGYDFLNRVNTVFVNPGAEDRFSDIYRSFTGISTDYAEVLEASKRQILDTSLNAELQRLTGVLAQLCSERRRHSDHTRRSLREALAGVIAAFPVYRLYSMPGGEASLTDREQMEHAATAALDRDPDMDAELIGLISELALGRAGGGLEAEFNRQFHQLTAPVMAKGAEDTAFYRYNRLLSLNEVGGDPSRFGIDVDTFHRRTADTAENWPDTMLTLGTHDTKRSADVRARVNVLTELPGEWEAAVAGWHDLNDPLRRDGIPDANTEYHLYQTLVGAWPISVERVHQYMTKAMREAKTETSWMAPDPDFESAVGDFIAAAMGNAPFIASIEGFLDDHDVVPRGRRSSLRQLTLLLTCPGVPDIYQGSELEDLSLVDPDNRRPVDFSLRRKVLSDLRDSSWSEAGVAEVSGAAKMWLIRRLLRHPREEEAGRYEPLIARGERADEILAYLSGGRVAVVPVRSETDPADVSVEMPAGNWHNLLTGRTAEGGQADLSDLLGGAPVAVLDPAES